MKTTMSFEMKVIVLVVAMIVCKVTQKSNIFVVGEKFANRENLVHNMLHMLQNKSEVKPPRILSQNVSDRVRYAKFRKPMRVPRLIRIQGGLRMNPFRGDEVIAKIVDQGVFRRIGNTIRSTRVKRFRNIRAFRF